jgi:hypothetical protein
MADTLTLTEIANALDTWTDIVISVRMDELTGYNASFWRDAASHLCRKVIRPVFDSIWNAAGWPRSMNYDEAGEWGKGINSPS